MIITTIFLWLHLYFDWDMFYFIININKRKLLYIFRYKKYCLLYIYIIYTIYHLLFLDIKNNIAKWVQSQLQLESTLTLFTLGGGHIWSMNIQRTSIKPTENPYINILTYNACNNNYSLLYRLLYLVEKAY